MGCSRRPSSGAKGGAAPGGTPPSAIHYPHAAPICCHRPNRWSRRFQDEESCNIFLTLTLISGPGGLREELAPGPEPPTPLVLLWEEQEGPQLRKQGFHNSPLRGAHGQAPASNQGEKQIFPPPAHAQGSRSGGPPGQGGYRRQEAESSQDLLSPEPWEGDGPGQLSWGSWQAAGCRSGPQPHAEHLPRAQEGPGWSHPHGEALKVDLTPAPCI